MYTKEQLNDLYERIAKTIDITDELFEAAEKEYNDMSRWIDEQTQDYNISIYSQGSFALGTVVKPLDDRDDYDLDLVCQFEQQYGLSAKVLKCDIVKPLLESYRKINGEIEEKRRCWHVEYEDVPNFHMDIIPAVNRDKYIDITDHDEETDSYAYIGSNPEKYIEWFRSKKEVRQKIIFEKRLSEMAHSVTCQAEVEELKEYKLKTPLQKAIQILKRHRDIMFAEDTNHCKPISIIITTIAAELYQNEDNIVDTLINILENAESYIKKNIKDSNYHIDNPTYTGPEKENFADKWNEHPERAEAFFQWLKRAQNDLVSERVFGLYRPQMADNLSKVLGDKTIRQVFDKIADEDRNAIESQKAKLSATTGIISHAGTIPVQRNHNHGEV
jgi:hypothetical protein